MVTTERYGAKSYMVRFTSLTGDEDTYLGKAEISGPVSIGGLLLLHRPPHVVCAYEIVVIELGTKVGDILRVKSADIGAYADGVLID